MDYPEDNFSMALMEGAPKLLLFNHNLAVLHSYPLNKTCYPERQCVTEQIIGHTKGIILLLWNHITREASLSGKRPVNTVQHCNRGAQ